MHDTMATCLPFHETSNSIANTFAIYSKNTISFDNGSLRRLMHNHHNNTSRTIAVILSFPPLLYAVLIIASQVCFAFPIVINL